MKTLNLRALGLLCVMTLGSCNVGVKDPSYPSLFAKADTAVKGDEIVGMWHRHHNVPGGLGFRMSLLFQRDGTGMVDSVTSEQFIGQRSVGDEIGKFSWSYRGGGVWALTNRSGRVDFCRLSEGRLLREYNSQAWHATISGPGNYVYERVNP